MLSITLLFLAAGCGQKQRRNNLILVTLDTTRADRLGCYGYTNNTPALDSLAARGTLFENTYTCIPITLPAHATLLTGLLPPEHGVRMNGENALPSSITTLTEQLKDEGYETGAFLASYVLHRKFGLDQGFDEYDDQWMSDAPAVSAIQMQRKGEYVIKSATNWLEQVKNEPFFCWIHLFDPHSPYDPHTALFGDTYIHHAYDAEIAYMDMQIQKLIDYIDHHKLGEDTLIVVVGDHGEGLGDHHEQEHGHLLYNSTIHVPLIIVEPGKPAGKKVNRPVSFQDIYCTMLKETIGQSVDCEVEGNTLTANQTASTAKNHTVYSETYVPYYEFGFSPLLSLTDERWKFIQTTKPELYDLHHDPKERHNCISQHIEQAERLQSALENLIEEKTARTVKSAQTTESDRQILSSLGYIGGSYQGNAEEHRQLADMKDMIHVLNTVDHAHQLLRKGNRVEAISLYQAACHKAPDSIPFYLFLAKALYRNGEFKRALSTLQSIPVQESMTENTMILALTMQAAVLAELDQLTEAEDLAREAYAVNPDNERTLNTLAWLLVEYIGSPTAAEEALELALKLDHMTGGYNPQYLDTLASTYAANGYLDKAQASISKAITLAEKAKRHMLAAKLRKRAKTYR